MRWLIIIFATALSFSAWALDLQQAKQQGLVGEQLNGLVGIVLEKSDVGAVANDINRKRLASYQDIAKRTGTSLTVVQTRAGQYNIERTQAGHYIQLADGSWRKK
ncbi:MAG: YdbL family protein [Oceanisphaera sp.]|uniref:YdbL family protein n=1 Tax=Oceanisphaera sp. TaxID=1929979 RepID=UPI003F9E5855